jgi:hypothetical protein
MPEGLDEISRQIGRLEAEAFASQQHRTLVSVKLDEIKAALAPLASLPTHIQAHCREIDELKAQSNRVTGAIWAAGAVGSLTTLLVSNAKNILKMFGGGS